VTEQEEKSFDQSIIKSPDFGQQENMCFAVHQDEQLRKDQIMAPSNLIEVHQMSNYKSPCVCNECIQRIKANNEEVDQKPFEQNEGSIDEHHTNDEINFECIYKQYELLC
jgi:hypothetical protein